MRTCNFVQPLALMLSLCSVSAFAGDPPAAPQSPPAPALVQPAAAERTAEKAVYDESADASADIAAALTRAQRNNTRVLVVWGANWCGWCKWLHQKCRSDRDIATELRTEYEVVRVDVGQFDKHQELLAKYEAGAKTDGIPYLTVLDGTGAVITNQETSSLENPAGTEPKGHDAAKILAFLKQHEAPKVDANEALKAASARAKSEGKLVFLHFGAPWCGWCHRLEDWLATPEVSSILSKAFVDLKVDTDRMPGGEALLKAHSKGENGGVPWSEVLDCNGNALVNSNGPQGNIGYPAAAEEIAWFVEMLRKSNAKLSEDDIAALTESLRAAGKRRQ